jgi:DUF971 family protein
MVNPSAAQLAVQPLDIRLHQATRRLEIHFSDGLKVMLPAELMRVYSPSAEVQGHGPGQEVLQVGKRHVAIETLELVGHYGLKPRFSDGHDTGIYAWGYLHAMGANLDQRWRDYEERLRAAGASRDPS